MSSPVPKDAQPRLGPKARAIVHEEEGILERVQARLARDAKAPAGEREDLDAQLLELRDAVAEAKEEDVASLVGQMHQVAALTRSRGQGRAVPLDPKSPYFGHLRLKDRQRQSERDVLIGRHTMLDDGDGLSVVDWRNAPVSRLYYRYEEGDEYEEEFDDRTLEGEVLVRRSVAIHEGALRRIAAPQGTFAKDRRGRWREAVGTARPTLQGGQGAALRVPRDQLGVHGEDDAPRADKHLQEITALIDRRQFELITRPESGVILIQGGAGSGKTTVALHRVAYLAFQDPRRFHPSKCLVMVFNDALVEYIRHVLPSLGVQGVQVTTYRRWGAALLARLRLPLPQVRCEDTPEAVGRFKKHPAVIRMIEELVAEKLRGVGEDLARRAGAPGLALWEEFASMAPLPRVRRALERLSRAPLSAAQRAATETVLRQAVEHFSDVVEDYLELATAEDRIRAGLAAHAPGEFSEQEIDVIVRWCAAKADLADSIDPSELPSRALPDEEDDAIILRLVQLQQGGLLAGGRRVQYEHVVIDEAQDLCPLEMRVLLDCVTVGKSVTIAGDRAQKMIFDNGFTDWPQLLADAGLPHTAIQPLSITYRSTRQVMELSRHVLGPLASDDEAVVAREGAPVAFFPFGDVGESVAFLGEALRGLMQREPSASVALITRYPQQADVYYRALRMAEVPRLRRVAHQDFSFSAGIDVTDVRQVKGLEFDYVVLLDVTRHNYPTEDRARHLLHVAATRAAFQLWITAAGPPSELLPEELVATGLFE